MRLACLAKTVISAIAACPASLVRVREESRAIPGRHLGQGGTPKVELAKTYRLCLQQAVPEQRHRRKDSNPVR